MISTLVNPPTHTFFLIHFLSKLWLMVELKAMTVFLCEGVHNRRSPRHRALGCCGFDDCTDSSFHMQKWHGATDVDSLLLLSSDNNIDAISTPHAVHHVPHAAQTHTGRRWLVLKGHVSLRSPQKLKSQNGSRWYWGYRVHSEREHETVHMHFLTPALVNHNYGWK